MARSRPAARIPSEAPSEAPSESSSSSSPERAPDDDTEDFFMVQANDSQSSLGINNLRDMSVSQDLGQDLSEAPVDRLPPELLISIFNKLSSAHDMRTVLLVSKKWAVNVVALLWHRPTCNTWPNLEKISAAVLRPDGLFQYRDLIKRLNLSGLNDRVNDGSIKGFEVCKRIERLTLTNCSKLSDMGVSNLLEGNKHLQALDVSDVKSLTDHTLDKVAENCPRLQGLNITGCFKVTDQSLIRISRRCRQIKRVGYLNFDIPNSINFLCSLSLTIASKQPIVPFNPLPTTVLQCSRSTSTTAKI
jgi:F-box and leucine-rich repeat protein GRR1